MSKLFIHGKNLNNMLQWIRVLAADLIGCVDSLRLQIQPGLYRIVLVRICSPIFRVSRRQSRRGRQNKSLDPAAYPCQWAKGVRPLPINWSENEWTATKLQDTTYESVSVWALVNHGASWLFATLRNRNTLTYVLTYFLFYLLTQRS